MGHAYQELPHDVRHLFLRESRAMESAEPTQEMEAVSTDSALDIFNLILLGNNGSLRQGVAQESPAEEPGRVLERFSL